MRFSIHEAPKIASLFLAFTFLLCSCSHKVHRYGYAKKDLTYVENCEVRFVRDTLSLNGKLIKVGATRLGDSGVSISCGEERARETLKEEACGLGANIVCITYEQYPDFLSTCYRCNADFYHLISETGDTLTFEKDPYVVDIEDAPLSPSKEKQNGWAMVAGGVVGFLFGYFVLGPLLFN